MKTHAHTLVQLCASSWAWLAVCAAPLEDHLLPLEHRGTVEVYLPEESPLGPGVVIPEGGSFMVTGEDGAYRFGLQSEDQWRMESRDAEGVVEGRYVYQNPEGQLVDISYNAGPQGFIAEGDAIPGGRAPLVDAPVDDEVNQSVQGTEDTEEEVKGIPYKAVLYEALPESDKRELQAVVVRADNNLDLGLPYGALALRGIPGYEPVFPGNNRLGDDKPYGAIRNTNAHGDIHIVEDEEAQAIIVPAVLSYGALSVREAPGNDAHGNDPAVYEDQEAQAVIVPVPAVWPPQLIFNPIIALGRDNMNDIIYGPPILDGEELESGVIEA